ncbi:hypothetical protein TUZN_2012 [Thermoproteus uzoniensis 768-20]|uniref:Uncharacterized protein n=1 Tax=Thermoproteus uzoniensis (strain 768-20) TaxID=999630 RepID=F2L4W6_THEU7|nr:hypothetical protein [Thermoproteus uzoniensis]AEA13470.1 hypothetical protein TUZN_2012 [Thermoproteus uzoniensis 768-20]
MAIVEVAKPSVVFKTDLKCPKCGSDLTFIEEGDNVWLGCDRCALYIKISKRDVRRYWNYVSRRVLWRDLLQDLYGLFKDAALG